MYIGLIKSSATWRLMTLRTANKNSSTVRFFLCPAYIFSTCQHWPLANGGLSLVFVITASRSQLPAAVDSYWASANCCRLQANCWARRWWSIVIDCVL